MQFLIALAVAAIFGHAAFIFNGTTYWRRRSWRQVFRNLIADLHHSRPIWRHRHG
jgi:hypothetical protein